MKELITIQSRLKCAKNQRNKFGNYNYRSCEDILEAVKPLLAETGCTLTITDDISLIGDRYYIKATATLTNSNQEKETTSAFAREEDVKKGMDASQLTGATSSYARKYALNGLFAIDDNKDADFTNKHGKDEQAQAPTPAPALTIAQQKEGEWIAKANACKSRDELGMVYNAAPAAMKTTTSQFYLFCEEKAKLFK